MKCTVCTSIPKVSCSAAERKTYTTSNGVTSKDVSIAPTIDDAICSSGCSTAGPPSLSLCVGHDESTLLAPDPDADSVCVSRPMEGDRGSGDPMGPDDGKTRGSRLIETGYVQRLGPVVASTVCSGTLVPRVLHGTPLLPLERQRRV